MHGLVASGDGRVVIRMSRHGDDPELVGAEVAHALLVDGGGSGIDGFDAVRRRGALGPRRMTVYLVGAGPGDPGCSPGGGRRCSPRPTSFSTTAWCITRSWPWPRCRPS